MGYTDGNTAGTDPYITYTYYGYGYNGDSYTYYLENCLRTDLDVNNAKTGLINVGNYYWLASRCAKADLQAAFFCVRYMYSDGSMAARSVFNSSSENVTPPFAVRPVVSLDSNVSLEYDSAKSTSSTTYWNVEF